MRIRVVAVAALAALCLTGDLAAAQTADNVLVVANTSFTPSLEIARHYIAARRIPDDHLVQITTAVADQISRIDYEGQIQAPLSRWLAAHAAQDRILYIVLTSGIPLRIAGTSGRNGTTASVDSELALLYRRMTGVIVSPTGPVPNPYYLADAPPADARPFSHARHDIFLVTRLAGFSQADAFALIDRGAAPVTTGRILLDAPAAERDPRVGWLEAAAARLAESGWKDRVVLDTTSLALHDEPQVLGYYSWGSNDPALRGRHPNLGFVPGALASMFLSTDARTFTEPPADWKPELKTPAAGRTGGSQSLVGDLIRSGATGVAGQVAEPYLDGAIRPDILFPAYAAGFNLAEAFYLAMPSLSWQTVIVGDPLCAPFRSPALAADEPNPPVDPETEMPARFSARRLAIIGAHSNPAAVKLLLRAESRLARSDRGSARQALEEALALDDQLTPAWHMLASIHEQEDEYAKANDVYKRLIALNRNDIIALNNLAYNLAVRDHQPRQALSFAERAAALARTDGNVSDTLGWIKHLLGEDQDALRLLESAVKALPTSIDILLHTAAVYAALGRFDAAGNTLKRARELDAAVQDRPEFREVQQKISAKGSPSPRS